MQRARLRSRRAPTLHHRRETEAPAPSGPYAAITALQQSAGTRVTRAAIAGKRTPVADGILLGHTGDVQRAGGGGPVAGKASASQAVDITTIAGPKDLGSGGFQWSVWFSIGAPAGILHSTTTQPPFWDGSGTTHNIAATWDDTGAAKVSDVEAQAGATRIKGTP